jgi:hypothetical protein
MKQRFNKRNRKAFQRVLDEYRRRKDKSLLVPLDLSIPKGGFDEKKATDSDFYADFELTCEHVIEDTVLLARFLSHVLVGEDELSEGELKMLEDKVGRELIKREIWPLKQYFTTVKH